MFWNLLLLLDVEISFLRIFVKLFHKFRSALCPFLFVWDAGVAEGIVFRFIFCSLKIKLSFL